MNIISRRKHIVFGGCGQLYPPQINKYLREIIIFKVLTGHEWERRGVRKGAVRRARKPAGGKGKMMMRALVRKD